MGVGGRSVPLHSHANHGDLVELAAARHWCPLNGAGVEALVHVANGEHATLQQNERIDTK